MSARKDIEAEAVRLRASAQKRRDDARASVESWETALGIAREQIRLAQRAFERAEDGLAQARGEQLAQRTHAKCDDSEADGLDRAAQMIAADEAQADDRLIAAFDPKEPSE